MKQEETKEMMMLVDTLNACTNSKHTLKKIDDCT